MPHSDTSFEQRDCASSSPRAIKFRKNRNRPQKIQIGAFVLFVSFVVNLFCSRA
jgi:hypothetical protein